MLGLLLALLFGSVVAVFVYSAFVGVVAVRGITLSAATGGVSVYFVNGYTNMYIWIDRGISGLSWAGLILILGLIVFISVLVWNLVETGGRTAVR